MHTQNSLLLGLTTLAASVIAAPVEKDVASVVDRVPDVVKRVSLAPSAYPYGQEHLNEFRWHGWDPKNMAEKADAVKIHNAYGDWANMIAFAWREADQVTDTFKRWFDASHAHDVKKVLERMQSQSGVQQPTPLMKEWICGAASSTSARRASPCPTPGTSNAPTDLDASASAKMKSVAFRMVLEITHWVKVGDAALGKHITDKANGADDCFKLSKDVKLINAQNYAFLAAEAYYKVKGCKFGDPKNGIKR